MSTATDMLEKYLTAEKAILEGKQVSFNGRTLAMESLEQVIAGRKEWQQKVAAETATAAGAPKIGGLTFAVAKFGG